VPVRAEAVHENDGRIGGPLGLDLDGREEVSPHHSPGLLLRRAIARLRRACSLFASST
jgi:hypothetical protein